MLSLEERRQRKEKIQNKRLELVRKFIQKEKGTTIFIEGMINELIRKRYPFREINTDSSYIYQKMDKLVDKKIYLPVHAVAVYPRNVGYINIFELHERLESIIRNNHLPHRNERIYTEEEKEYMENFIRDRRLSEDRGTYVF